MGEQVKDYTKEIRISDNEVIRFQQRDSYNTIDTITYANLEDGIKTLQFFRWDDYGINSYTKMDFEDYKKATKESHVIRKNNPLYIPLLHLLNGNKELIIDDDSTEELNQKYMKIYLDGENINVDFIYNVTKDHDIEKFNIFIKNVTYDLRSKIDCQGLDTKERLYFFFKEMIERFREEDHQMTTEEYMLENGGLDLEESKKYVKKLEFKL